MVGLYIIQLFPVIFYALIIWKFVNFTKKRQKSQGELDSDPVNGLGGWLIFVGLGLLSGIGGIATLLARVATVMANYFSGTSEDELFNPLISLESLASNDAIAWIIVIESAIYILLLLSFIPLLYQFLTKKPSFPKNFIAFNVIIVLFFSLKPLTIDLVPLHILSEEMHNQTTMVENFTQLALSLILIAYMLVSKRVKATFVKQ